MSTDILEKNISELFGFSEMTDEEKAELLDNIGSVIMESAVLRFITSAEEKEISKLEQFIDRYENDDALLEKLLREFPSFQDTLEEEIAAFKTEAVEVLS